MAALRVRSRALLKEEEKVLKLHSCVEGFSKGKADDYRRIKRVKTVSLVGRSSFLRTTGV